MRHERGAARLTEEMSLLLVQVYFLVPIRDALLLERDPRALDEWAELRTLNQSYRK